MSPAAQIARLTISLLVFAAAGTAMATNNTSALLGAVEPVVIELRDNGVSSPSKSTQHIPARGSVAISPAPTKVTARRLPNQSHSKFDWSTLVSLGFGIVGLLWVRRRTADL